jgi:hypothetical protein
MSIRTMARSVSLLVAVTLLPAPFLAAETSKSFETQKEGVRLLGQLEGVAREIRHNADRLSAFSRDTYVSTGTHYNHLDQIKSSVNDGLRPVLTRLLEIQPKLPAWQQDAIDQMLDSAQAIAADANSAILAKREAGSVPPPLHAEYKDLLARIYERSHELVETSKAAGGYADAYLQAVDAGLTLPEN